MENNFLSNKDLKSQEQDPLIVNLVAQMEQTNIMMRNYVRILAEVKEVRSLMSNHINVIFQSIDNQQKMIDMLFEKLQMQKPDFKEVERLTGLTEIKKEDIDDLNKEDFQEQMIRNMINPPPEGNL
jgi:hypothetical protein